MSDARKLIELQECDLQKLRTQRQLDELPEAAQIMECRAKRKELKGKQDQVIELTDDVNTKIAKLQNEEERVIAKIKELQDTLDHTSDYRVTNSVTKEMQGQVKRQGSIAEEVNALLERQIKIDDLANTVADMLSKLDHKEHHLTEDFKKKGGALKAQIQGYESRRAELIGTLDPAIAKRYEKLAQEKNGIGVGKLEDGVCTACHGTLMEGQLRKALQGPVLSECPNCHRILITKDEGDA